MGNILERRRNAERIVGDFIAHIMCPRPSIRARMLTGTSWPAMIRAQDAERHTRRRAYRKRNGALCDGRGRPLDQGTVALMNRGLLACEIHPFCSLQGNM